MSISISTITLVGHAARLEPLSLDHASDLYAAGREDAVWTYLARGPFVDVEDARGWIGEALRLAAGGTQCPFAIIDLARGRAVGSTRYMDIRANDDGLEIGWTWHAPEAQRTAINTECKLMLLRHAFERLGCVRVQLKTDARNLRSQRAIERIGGVREGVLRKHLRVRDGFIRDSVMYSIVRDEWPSVRERLERLMNRERSTSLIV